MNCTLCRLVFGNRSVNRGGTPTARIPALLAAIARVGGLGVRARADRVPPLSDSAIHVGLVACRTTHAGGQGEPPPEPSEPHTGMGMVAGELADLLPASPARGSTLEPFCLDRWLPLATVGRHGPREPPRSEAQCCATERGGLRRRRGRWCFRGECLGRPSVRGLRVCCARCGASPWAKAIPACQVIMRWPSSGSKASRTQHRECTAESRLWFAVTVDVWDGPEALQPNARCRQRAGHRSVPRWTLRPRPAYHDPNALRPGAARNTGVQSWRGATSSFRW